MAAIIRYTGDTLSQVESWVALSEDERRRRAILAAQHRDPIALWELTRAHLLLHGGKGAHLSRHTERSYATGIRVLCHDWRDVNLIHPERDRSALWLRRLETNGLSPSTITVRLAAARALYRALRWARATDADPLADLRPAPDPTPDHEKRAPYTQPEIESLLALATGEDRVLILLGAHAGLRVSEMLALTWDDIDLTARTVIVRHGKGQKQRTVTLSRTLIDALGALPRTHACVLSHGSDVTARRRLRVHCRRAGVTFRGVHALRHSCGTRLYRQTGKLEIAQRALGHSSISTTQIYVHWSNDELSGALGSW